MVTSMDIEDEVEEVASAGPGLVMNFYKDSCPQAEDIIKEQVQLLYKRHKNTAFSWLRNIFHDCAVQLLQVISIMFGYRVTVVIQMTQ
ncbi:peroxidase 42-like [Apium graveolens]|uniref:peroxidase 42-like n=1 Tax=Apium graveolens TaxID=4045 RepID=UPI003D7BE237